MQVKFRGSCLLLREGALSAGQLRALVTRRHIEPCSSWSTCALAFIREVSCMTLVKTKWRRPGRQSLQAVVLSSSPSRNLPRGHTCQDCSHPDRKHTLYHASGGVVLTKVASLALVTHASALLLIRFQALGATRAAGSLIPIREGILSTLGAPLNNQCCDEYTALRTVPDRSCQQTCRACS